MGRGKLALKYIEKEKLRISTYHKRKKGLMKKAEEFSTLCGVETCMIMYGPKTKDNSPKLEIWPSDPAQVMNVIDKYKEKPQDVRERKCFNVYDLFASRQKKLDDEIYKLRKANADAKFPTWDDRLNHLSADQTLALLARLDSKIEAVTKKINETKGNNLPQSLVEADNSKLEVFATQPRLNLSNQARLDIEVTCQKHPNTGLKPFDMNIVPSFDPFNAGEALQMQPLNLNRVDNSMMMLSTNGSDTFNQVDGGESSSSITYSSLSPQAAYDPTAPMLDNVPFNNPWGFPCCFYTPFVEPPPPFGQYSATPSFPSHQFGEFYRDVDDQHEAKNKKQRF